MMALASISDCELDSAGIFKYVLLRISDDTNASKLIVRGHKWASYHADIFDKVEEDLRKVNLNVDCEGGGRIEIRDKQVKVYGYSMGFGRADHAVSTDIIKKALGNEYSVTWSNDGY